MQTPQLIIDELKHYIMIGFCQRKFYKQSVWKKAEYVMQFLVKQQLVDVRVNHGGGKYWRNDKSLNLTYDDLAGIAYNLGATFNTIKGK